MSYKIEEKSIKSKYFPKLKGKKTVIKLVKKVPKSKEQQMGELYRNLSYSDRLALLELTKMSKANKKRKLDKIAEELAKVQTISESTPAGKDIARRNAGEQVKNIAFKIRKLQEDDKKVSDDIFRELDIAERKLARLGGFFDERSQKSITIPSEARLTEPDVLPRVSSFLEETRAEAQEDVKRQRGLPRKERSESSDAQTEYLGIPLRQVAEPEFANLTFVDSDIEGSGLPVHHKKILKKFMKQHSNKADDVRMACDFLTELDKKKVPK